MYNTRIKIRIKISINEKVCVKIHCVEISEYNKSQGKAH